MALLLTGSGNYTLPVLGDGASNTFSYDYLTLIQNQESRVKNPIPVELYGVGSSTPGYTATAVLNGSIVTFTISPIPAAGSVVNVSVGFAFSG